MSLNIKAQLSENYFFDHYSIQEGLSHINVSTVYQDSKGLTWIGTYDGLGCWDGYKFRTYRHYPGDSTSLIHHRVRSIIESHDGLIWIGTEEGLCIFDPNIEQFYTLHIKNFPNAEITVLKLFEDDRKRMWVLTNNNTIYVIPNERNSCRSIYYYKDETVEFNDIVMDHDKNFIVASSSGLVILNTELEIINDSIDADFKNKDFKVIQIENGNRIWLGTNNGILLAENISKSKKLVLKQKKYILQGKEIADIIIDKNESIWVALRLEGLVRFTPRGDDYISKRFIYEPGKINTLSSNRLRCLFKDKQGDLWIGSGDNGINKLRLTSDGIIVRSRLNTPLESDYILSFGQINDSLLLVGAREKGIYVTDINTGKVVETDYNFSELKDKSVFSMIMDSRGIVWFATWSGLYALIPNEKTVIKIDQNIGEIYDICEDYNGSIWIGTLVGLKRLIIENNFSISDYREFQLKSGPDNVPVIIRDIYLDPHDGNLWLGTFHNGLFNIDVQSSYKNNPNKLKYTNYQKNAENPNSLNSNFITSILKTSEKDIWVGTEGGGFNHGIIKDDQISFTNYNVSKGLSNNSVKIISQDHIGNLWIGTNNGLNFFSIGTQKIISFDQNDGLPSNYFNNNSSLNITNNKLVFGGNKGFMIVDPYVLVKESIIPRPEFGSFQLSYQTIRPLEKINGKVLLNKSISKKEKLILSHNQNTFSFELLALQCSDPLDAKLKYKLHGYDNEWIYPQEGNHYANYTKVSPGEYQFEFNVANKHGQWSTPPKYIDIKIMKPIWLSNVAVLFYTLIFTVIIFIIFRIYRKIIILKQNVEFEKIQTEKNKELTEAKVKFFMNVSHEFKTPLTLILGPLQWLKTKYSNDNMAKSYLTTIKNQADYLKSLLDQLIYFRKVESDSLELKCQYSNILPFVKDILKSYKWQANEQKVEIKVVSDTSDILIWFDKNKMERIFHNLISNALKYTSGGGQILIGFSTNEDENTIDIIVKDTGIGIPPENLDSIFDRFFQVDESNGGYGIGLSITKSLIELHKGTISVKSKVGIGSEFLIKLKTGKNHLKEEQLTINQASPEIIKSGNDSVSRNIVNNQDTTIETEKELILIVDDNLRVLSFLDSILNQQYNTITAQNGQEALDLVGIQLPDLIISDVMMPKMDGITLCKRIKTEMLTCHIPVILLTVKSDIENRIEGIEQGADYYIPKPFDLDLLLAEVNGLIMNRKRIKERFRMNLPFDIKAENIHPLDKDFLNRIKDVIEKNYTNPKFNSNEFSKQVFLNRSLFFKKMKSFTNQTPAEFLREYRIRKSLDLMVKENLSISDVHDRVGISSRSHFCRCFKDIYGSSPSDYLKNNAEKGKQ